MGGETIMIKNYIKLVYISFIGALSLVVVVNVLQGIQINNLIFNQIIQGLALTQLVIYAYKDYKWIQSFLKTKCKVVYNFYIPLRDIPFKENLRTVEVLKTSLYQLNVIRC